MKQRLSCPSNELKNLPSESEFFCDVNHCLVFVHDCEINMQIFLCINIKEIVMMQKSNDFVKKIITDAFSVAIQVRADVVLANYNRVGYMYAKFVKNCSLPNHNMAFLINF